VIIHRSRCRAGINAAPIATAFSLVSRPLNAVASSGTVADAISSNYNNRLQITGTTGSVWIDISTLTAAQKASMALYWYNEVGADTTTLYFDLANATGSGGAQTNLPTAYTIKGSTQAGGGSSVPSTGLSTLVTVASNGYQSRKHAFSAAGLNWVGMDITSSSGSNLQLKLDLYDVSAGVRDMLHLGDSRTWFGLNHANPHGGGTAADSIGNLMQPTAGFYLPTICAGMSGAKVADIASLVSGWLTAMPGFRYATVNIGINDALASSVNGTWSTNYQSLVNTLIAAGVQKVFCETIGDTTSATPHAALPAYNSAIASIVSGTPGCFTGYDEYQYFIDNPSQISGDQVHATDAGFAGLRVAKAAYYATRI
jgi:hypothetical protein